MPVIIVRSIDESCKDRALGDGTVGTTPLGDRVQRVEEEVRIEMALEREQLRVIGLARQRLGSRACATQVGFEIDVAREPPAADPEQTRGTRRGSGSVVMKVGPRPKIPGNHAADSEHDRSAEAGIDDHAGEAPRRRSGRSSGNSARQSEGPTRRKLPHMRSAIGTAKASRL